MMKKANPLIFTLIFVAIIWPLSFLVFKAKTPEARTISNIVSTKPFLSTLQNKSADGCVAMTYMDRVDVIIVGSSLAYSNIDPLILSEKFGTQAVAVCALSGWNTDYFKIFFDFMKANNIAPNRLVWLADQSSHLKVNLHERRLDYAKTALFDDEFQDKTAQRWIDSLGTKEKSAELLDKYTDRIETHSKHLSALSVTDVTQIILDTEFETELAVLNLAKTAKTLPRNEKKLRQLCANISQRAIIFDVVIAPMPTTSKKVFNDAFGSSESLKTDSAASYYKNNLNCARSIVSKPLESWGLDNRYFLNRDLRDDYPYEAWGSPETFSTYYNTLGKRDRLWFYDVNHLNGIGATIFTENLAKELK